MFREIKKLLTSAAALGLPEVTRDLSLFAREQSRTALGVLTVGPQQRPTANLSRRLELVAAGWPPCLWALSAAVILVREADKLMLGHSANVKAPRAVTALMNNSLSGAASRKSASPS